MATQELGRIEAAAPRAAERTGPRLPPTRAKWYTPYLFLAPYLILFTAFSLVPTGMLFWISLHDWDFLLPGKPFVGLDNFQKLFDSASTQFDPFWKSMKATGLFTLLSVPLLVVIPLGLAIILNQKFPGRTFFRAVYFTPYVLGVGVIGVLWQFLLDPNIGYVNYLLGSIGLRDNIAWTTQSPWVWVSLVGVTVWWTLGFNAVIYLAGLQDIPRELYEAAKVDGAGLWQRFRAVTLPGIRTVLTFVIIITIIASANMFGQSYLITQGAPGNETRTAIYYIADQGLRQFKMGDAAAMSLVLTFILMAASILFFAVSRKLED